MKKSKLTLHLFLPLLLFVLMFAGCAHYPLNQPLETASQKDIYDFKHFDHQKETDGTFVVLTFSGGGTRAASLAYGVINKMRDIPVPGSNMTLLENVDIISTVSGGSFTGAYYALFGDRIFIDFKDKFLYRNIEEELGLQLLKPINWIRLLSPYFSRIDMAAELYDQTIFESKTFSTLAERAKRPFLIINATNMYQGAQFEFTGEQFAYIGSDILSYPISRAVAASSAFPFLLSPISLKNYSPPGDYRISKEDELAMQDYWNNKRRYYSAKNNLMYGNLQEHRFIHLMDGGLADNLGLRAVYDLYVRGDIREKINNGEIKRLLVIVVNAKAERPQDIDMHESPPGLITVGLKTCTLSLDNYTFDTVEIFKSMMEERAKAQESISSCQNLIDMHCKDGYKIPKLAGGQMKLYVVDLSFDNLSDQTEKDFFNRLPTSFALDKSQVDKLIEVGGRLLVENPEFKQFLMGYGSNK